MITFSESLWRSHKGRIAHAAKSEPLLYETMRSEAQAIMEHLRETQDPALRGSVRELLRAFFQGRVMTPDQERVLLSMPKQMLSFEVAVEVAVLALLSTALTSLAKAAAKSSRRQGSPKSYGPRGK